MKLHSRAKQYIVFLLAFLMAFEPFAVNMVYAGGSPDDDNVKAEITVPEAEAENLSGDPDDTETIMNEFQKLEDNHDNLKPVDYLNYLYTLRGRSKIKKDNGEEKIENAIVWGEWMNTMSGAYAVMDDGCSDVFSFYGTLGAVTTEAINAPMYLDCIQWAANKASLAGAFIAKVTHLNVVNQKVKGWLTSKGNLMKGFKAVGKYYSKGLKNTTDFISHMCPPVGFRKGCGTGEGFVSYWRWVARKTGLENSDKYREGIKKLNKHLSKENQISTNRGAAVMKNSKGVAHSIGIGLAVLGVALDTYEFVKSEDRQVGRISYSLVKNVVSWILGVGSLIAMFCIPVVGQVLGIICLVWTAITMIFDQFGEYNKKWKEAYKNSFWYLLSSDPEFKSYYKNRDDLTEDEKSACYSIVEKTYGQYKENARAFEKNHTINLDSKEEHLSNDYYDDKSEEAVSARVYIELEKQGVLTSYYNRSAFKMPDFGLPRLLEMWKAKADYMSWKPTEEESNRAQNRGFWGTIGHAINPMTYISWAGDKIKSRDYNKMQEKNYPKVYYNPDFVLMKKYQLWITSNRKMTIADPNNSEEVNNNAFYRAIGLRMEQSPFNYIPLVGIELTSWSDDLLKEAFNADAFFIAIKEMMYFRNIIAPATKSVEDFTDQVTKSMKDTRKALDYFNDYRYEALNELFMVLDYKYEDEKAGKELLKKKSVKKAFNWPKWNDSYGKCTPRNIAKVYWNDINLALSLDPTSISQRGAECKLLLDTIKKNLDTAALMQALYLEKQDALDNFDSEFKNPDFNDYLKKGSFLDVKGSTFMDWLSEIYPAYKELDKYNKLYKKEIDKYAEAASESNQGHGKFLLFFTVKNDDNHPNKVLEDANSLLGKYQDLVSKFENNLASKLKDDGLTITIKSNDTGVYPQGGYETVEELKSLDTSKEIEDVVQGQAAISALIPAGDTDF